MYVDSTQKNLTLLIKKKRYDVNAIDHSNYIIVPERGMKSLNERNERTWTKGRCIMDE